MHRLVWPPDPEVVTARFFVFCLVLNIYFYFFIWLHPVSVVARGIFRSVMGDLFFIKLWHAGASSLTGD